uniref:Putative transcriptional regulatory protein n=1 Tax=Talaromyces marneffei PM1 TaxID=1077442 RepID=A0A093VCW8_TALMA
MPSQDHDLASMAPKKVYKSSRRNRVPLSCEPCRSRNSKNALLTKLFRLRCNRERPCSNCTVRDERASCKYESPKNGSAMNPQHHASKQRGSMQQRINHLEDLVKNLIAQNQKLPITPEGVETGPSFKDSISDASDSTHSPGKTVIDGGHSVYKGAEDWYDVLQEINKLKQVWSESQDAQPEYNVPPTLSNMVDGSSLLFGQVQRTDKIELLTTLPPKHQVDKLIHHFFDRDNFPISIVPILHEPTFMSEYAEHWEDPTKTSAIWLGLLFSILSINMLAYQQFGEPPDYEGMSESLFQLYRLRTAQCLIIGDIGKCLPYTIEALRLNATAELNRKDDNSRGLWIMTGVIVRAAINMGYHRDPSQSPSITPLQAEYRRRVWISVKEIDDMASFVVGFPRVTSGNFEDTREPRNLYDWELSVDLTMLPPSRPMSEVTPVAYLIAKARLFQALGQITDFNNIPTQGPYEQILDIDNNLIKAYQDLPADLRMHSQEWDYTAYANFTEDSSPRGEWILNTIIRGSDVYHRFSRARKVLTLSAMILFLELECRRKMPDTTNTVSPGSDDLLQVLSTSCAYWETAQTVCDDAQKTYKILSGMLSSFQTSLASSSPSQPETPRPLFEFPGMSSSLQPGNANFSDDKDWLSMSNEMNIDWASWDVFIEGAIFETED